jgi:hypothetical protein
MGLASPPSPAKPTKLSPHEKEEVLLSLIEGLKKIVFVVSRVSYSLIFSLFEEIELAGIINPVCLETVHDVVVH